MIQSPYFKKIVALLKISIFSKKCFFIFSLGPPPKNTPQEVTVVHTHPKLNSEFAPEKMVVVLPGVDDPSFPLGSVSDNLFSGAKPRWPETLGGWVTATLTLQVQ